MNRSTMYDYLKGIEELKPLFYKHGKGYHVTFVPKVWIKFSQIVVNEFLIEDFYSITLLIQKIIIKGEVSDMNVEIYYKDINKFDVYIEEGYKREKRKRL